MTVGRESKKCVHKHCANQTTNQFKCRSPPPPPPPPPHHYCSNNCYCVMPHKNHDLLATDFNFVANMYKRDNLNILYT
jgi:hypothetical protein